MSQVERKDWLFRKYSLPKELLKQFDKDMTRLKKCEGTDEWYELADTFEVTYGVYLV